MSAEPSSFATRFRLDSTAMVRKSIKDMLKVPAAAYSCSLNKSVFIFVGMYRCKWGFFEMHLLGYGKCLPNLVHSQRAFAWTYRSGT